VLGTKIVHLWYLEKENCACSYHDVPFLQHLACVSFTFVCQQEASNNYGSSSSSSSDIQNLINQQDHNL
jgi:hypothetical protein